EADRLALPREVRVWFDADFDVEIAGRTALGACFALTAQSQRRTLVDSRRDRHRDRAGVAGAAATAAARTGIGDLGAVATASRTGRSRHELSEDRLLDATHFARAAAGRALGRRLAVAHLRAVALLARLQAR